MDSLVEGLDHVAVTCPEELAEETFRWYEDVFGLERMVKPEGTRRVGAWFQLGRGELHVQIDEHNPPKIAHFGIVVNDIEEAVQRLRSARCHIEQAAKIPGRRRFYTRDPAGNRIEVIGFEGEAG